MGAHKVRVCPKEVKAVGSLGGRPCRSVAQWQGACAAEFGDGFVSSAVRACRDCSTENYGGHLQRVPKVAHGERGRTTNFIVRFYLLRLAKEGTTDSSLKGTVTGVRALEKLRLLPTTVSPVEHLLVKAIAQVNPVTGPRALHWGAPRVFEIMAGAAPSALDWESVAISAIATGARLRVGETLTRRTDA